jgi:transposase
VIEDVETGASRREAAERYGISPSVVVIWVQRFEETGSVAAKPSGGSISPLEQHAEFLLGLIANQPDLTLDEIVAAMHKRRIAGSRSAVWRFFARRNISFKKTLYAAEQKRADVARGLRQRAMTAPFVLEGAMNGPMFLAYVKQCLVPTLKRGEIVLMDHLPVHKVAGIAEAIEAAGATLIYLPKYSPDLNPIELAFSKLKAHLHKATEHTILRLLRWIGRVVTDFSPQECRNFFRHAGYART